MRNLLGNDSIPREGAKLMPRVSLRVRQWNNKDGKIH